MHDALGSDSIALRVRWPWIKGIGIDWRKKCGCDGHAGLELVAVFTEGVAGAEHASGNNGNSGTTCDHAQAVFHRLDIPIRTPGAFGKNEDPVAILSGLNDAFHGADLAFGVPVDGDGPEFREQPAHDRMIHEGVTGNIINDGADTGSNEWNIQMAHVIGGQNEGALSRNVGQPEVFHRPDHFECGFGDCVADGVDEAFFHVADWSTSHSLESIFWKPRGSNPRQRGMSDQNPIALTGGMGSLIRLVWKLSPWMQSGESPPLGLFRNLILLAFRWSVLFWVWHAVGQVLFRIHEFYRTCLRVG